MSESRSYWVDYAKAIGIILVVYGHVVRGLYSAELEGLVYLYDLVDSVIYSFHMPLFFFLSGLFFYDSFLKRGGKQLVFTKIDTVFYPYILWSVLQGSIEVFLSGYTNGDASYMDVFTLLWSPKAQFWFLYALFMIFVLASIIYSIASKKITIFLFLLASILYVYSLYLPSNMVFKFISENFVFFVFGIVFMNYFKVEVLSSFYMLLILLALFVFMQWLFHSYLGFNYRDKGFASLLLACVSIVFVVSISLCLTRKRYHFLAFIGTSSMAIYLMHILTGSGIRIVLDKVFGVESFIIHLIAGVLAGVLAPLLILIFIDKLKIPYVFSAPISDKCLLFYNAVLQKISR